MCNCLNESLEKVKAHVVENIGKDFDKESFDIEYQNKVWRMDGKKNDVMLGIEYSYFALKKGGERHKNRSKDTIKLAMSYCPMCGEKYV